MDFIGSEINITTTQCLKPHFLTLSPLFHTPCVMSSLFDDQQETTTTATSHNKPVATTPFDYPPLFLHMLLLLLQLCLKSLIF